MKKRTAHRLIRLPVKLLVALIAVVYLLLARSFLFLSCLYLFLYFGLSSQAARDSITSAITDSIPGVVTAETVQWGPMPGDVRLGHVRLFDPDGSQAFEITALRASVETIPTLLRAIKKLGGSDEPMVIRAKRLDILAPKLDLKRRADGTLNLTAALASKDAAPKASPATPLALDFHVMQATIREGSGSSISPSERMSWNGMNIELTGGVDGTGHLKFVVPHGGVNTFDLETKPRVATDGTLIPRKLPIRNLTLANVWAHGSSIHLGQLKMEAEEAEVQASARVTLDGDAPSWSTDLSVTIPKSSPTWKTWIALPTSANVDINITAQSSDSGPIAAGSVVVDDVQIGKVLLDKAEIDVEWKNNKLHVTEAIGKGFGGGVTVTEGTFTPFAEKGPAFAAKVQLQGVDPRQIIRVAGPWDPKGVVPFLEGNAVGNVSVTGQVFQTGAFKLDGITDDLTINWQGSQSIPMDKSYVISGGFGIDLQPEGTVLSDGSIDGRGHLTLDGITIKTGPDRVQANGIIDFGKGLFDLKSTIRSPRIGYLLNTVNVSGWSGAMELKKLSVTGTFTNPEAQGKLKLTGTQWLGRKLGTVTAQVSLIKGVTAVKRLQMQNPQLGNVEVSARMEIWKGEASNVIRSPRLRFSLLKVENLGLKALLPKLGIGGHVNFNMTRNIEFAVRSPLKTISGGGRIAAGKVASGKLRLREASGLLRAKSGSIQLNKAKISLCRGQASCKSGGPELAGSLQYSPAKNRFSSNIKLDDFPLKALKQFAPGLSMAGRLTTRLNLSGNPNTPKVMGTASVSGFKVGPAALGDFDLEFTWGKRPGQVIIHSSRFLRGASLEESELIFQKGNIRRVTIRVRTKKLDVFNILPEFRSRSLAIHHTGRVDFELHPRRKKMWVVNAVAEKKDLKLLFHDRKLSYLNNTIAKVHVSSDGIKLSPITLAQAGQTASGTQNLTLCGGMSSDGDLNLEATGGIGLNLIRPIAGISDAFSQFSGQLAIDALTGPTNTLNRCLPLSATRVFRIAGPASAPLLTGRLKVVGQGKKTSGSRRTGGLTLMPRGMGRVFNIDADSVIDFRPVGSKGRQAIILPNDPACKTGVSGLLGCFSGKLEDGSFRMFGRVELDRLALDSIDLKIAGADLYHSSSGEFNLTFNPDLRLLVSKFSDPEKRKLEMTGALEITDGTYYKSFDQIAKVVGSVSGGQVEEFGTPLTDRLPWLKPLKLKIALKSPTHNVNVSSAFPLGTANLDARFNLNLTGTLDNMQLFGVVDLAPGGTVSYKILAREFEVLEAYLEFKGDPETPEIKVRVQTTIVYLEGNQSNNSTSTSEERTVHVTVIISGVLPDALKVEFQSDPAGFDQGDLQNLLLTGKPLLTGATAKEDLQFNLPVGQVLKELLKSPFIKTVNVGVDSTGDWASEILTRLGRYASLHASAGTEEGDTTRLRMKFQFQISDNVTLEGNVDRRTTNSSDTEETYQTKIRYRIPLD